MEIFLIIFLLICLYKISFQYIKEYNNDFLNIENTTMINGIFVMLVLLSHFNSYVDTSNYVIYSLFMKLIGQLMVTTFLFYSGYGIYESIKNKKNYINSFFKNRILKLFIMFFLALLLYMLLNLIIGNCYPIKTILLSLIGYESIGNSNWYIFATFVMYFSVLFSFKFFKNNKTSLFIVLLMTLSYIAFMIVLKKGVYFYDTILCFPLGMYFSYYKDQIVSFIKNNKNYYLIFITFSLVFISTFFLRNIINNFIIDLALFEIRSILFVLLIILLTFKIQIGNKMLSWLGKNVFSIYILQRISYIIFQKWLLNNIFIYFLTSLLMTLILCYLFNKAIKVIFGKVYKNEKINKKNAFNN